jgi:hypothetical protein
MNRLVLGTILALSAILIATVSAGIGSQEVSNEEIKKPDVTPSPTLPIQELTPNQSIPPPEDKKELFLNRTTVKPPAAPLQKASNITSSAQKDPKETPEPIDGSHFITSTVLIPPTIETVHGALPLSNKSKKEVKEFQPNNGGEKA